jgi:hypothetical protein
MFPGGSRVGRPVFYERGEKLQAVSADCASFYQPVTDVTLARRSTLWTSAGFGLCVDTLRAERSHTWRWQAMLRPNLERGAEQARVRLHSGASVLLHWTAVNEQRVKNIEDFPKNKDELDFEPYCARLELLREGAESGFTVLFAPDAEDAAVERLDAHRVAVEIDGARHELVVDNFERRALAWAGGETDAVFAWCAPDGTVAERRDGVRTPAPEQTHTLPDIDEERGPAEGSPIAPLLGFALHEGVEGAGATRWARVDRTWAQLDAERPDLAPIGEELERGPWPNQMAAAEVAGRLGPKSAGSLAPLLRRMLEAEHAIPAETLYPPVDQGLDAEEAEQAGKRFRLKAALASALGRLRDAEAVPLLRALIADDRDFYPVYSQAVRALARIGGSEARAALQPALADHETNTQSRARDADAALASAGHDVAERRA